MSNEEASTAELADLARVEARFAVDLDLARTVVDCRAATIEPRRPISTGGRGAVEALRELGASLDRKIDIHETLGEGGMGVVHLATQTTLGRHVAVKTLRDGARGMDATLRILREAWVTGSLEHPNVVPIYDVGVDAAGSPVIVMKRIEGQSWRELMASPAEIAKRFGVSDPVEWNLRILSSVCNAAHFAHSRGVLHRDLKPENVMIGAFGEVYVLDWGIAISLRDDPTGRLPTVASATEVAGTPQYMAPEMLRGDPTALSARTDVYLLGAILYEIFSGVAPHDGDTLHALLTDILLGALRFAPSFPSEARRICERAMAKDPGGRYESAEALRRAIDEYLLHQGSRKLASEAEESRELLVGALQPADGTDDEERALRVANLLGECRFGYRAALAAWPSNDAARSGLDRALLAVVEYELRDGDPQAAATLLLEVSSPPADVSARAVAAVREREAHDARLRQMETDLDPVIGARTRSTLAVVFGGLWTLFPLVAWLSASRGHPPTYFALIAMSLGIVMLGFCAFVWARETLTKTLLNRRLSYTMTVYFLAQAFLAVGTWVAGVPVAQSELVAIFAWTLAFAMLAVWAEGWFAAPATACALSFLLSAAEPRLMYPLMAFDQLVFTVVLVRVWLPKGELARIQRRRQILRGRTRRWLRHAALSSPPGRPQEGTLADSRAAVRRP